MFDLAEGVLVEETVRQEAESRCSAQLIQPQSTEEARHKDALVEETALCSRM